MGEAKRRQQQDPKFGQAPKKKWLKLPEKLSTLELFLWIVIFVSSITTVVWTFTQH